MSKATTQKESKAGPLLVVRHECSVQKSCASPAAAATESSWMSPTTRLGSSCMLMCPKKIQAWEKTVELNFNVESKGHMSNFESTSGSEGVLKAQTGPFPVIESRAPFLRASPRARCALLRARLLHRPRPSDSMVSLRMSRLDYSICRELLRVV
jgi:hypothetical protein